jgi:dTMP kinase
MFIAFEGIDGSGKSSQIARLEAALRRDGRDVHVTREPTDGPIGSVIRQSLSGRFNLDDRVIAALFVADRLDHLVNSDDGIVDLVAAGVTVITDRYVLSSYAYHSHFVPLGWIVSGNSLSLEILRPSLTIYLDLAPDTALERLSQRRTLQKYETFERLHQVYEAYDLAIARSVPDMPIVRIDAAQDEEAVAAQVVAAVKETHSLEWLVDE